MKLVLMLSALLIMASCSQEAVKKTEVVGPEMVKLASSSPEALPPEGLLPPSKVIALFHSEGQMAGKLGQEKLSKAAQERKKHFIKEDTFFGKKIQSIKAKRMRIKAVEGAISYTGKGSVDLRGKDTPVVTQWDGTCTAHGLSAAMENFIGKPLQVNLSERHVWSGYRVYSCESAIDRWTGAGCVTIAAKWPNGNTYPKVGYLKSPYCFTKLKKNTYIEDDLQKMINALDADHPVYLGVTVTNSMANCDVALKPLSASTRGGHALSIVGYHLDSSISGGGYFIIKNSWGVDCADKGYQYVPFNYCSRSDMYCIMWTIDGVTSTPPAVKGK